MKRLVIALLSTSTIALAVPAFAHPEDHAGPAAPESAWNNGGATYANFNAEYQHIWDGIQHGLSDHAYTPAEADRFMGQMRRIRARADEMQRAGRYDAGETQAALVRLHDMMHEAHDKGHAQIDHAAALQTYAQFSREYQHVWDMIRHGQNDGSYTRAQGRQFSQTLRSIRDRAQAMQRSGRYQPQEIQARLDRLHADMHEAHALGHAELDHVGH